MVALLTRCLVAGLLLGAPALAQDLAIHCGKVLTMNAQDEIHSPGLILVESGQISYVGPVKEVDDRFTDVNRPHAWAAPGLVDLHTHIHPGGGREINDMVRSVNPELRACAALRPSNRSIQKALAAGVTTLFGIPGSGTNIGGFGILYKTTSSVHFERGVIERVGGMKVAQDSNPERRAGNFAFGNTRASMSWTISNVCERALGATNGRRLDPALRDLQRVMSRDLPVLIHTAGARGVTNTARMWHNKYATRCVISHGSFDGWKVAEVIADWGVRVNHGPRVMDFYPSRNGRINGTAAEYAKAGVPDLSLTTDSSVIPQEELFLQGTMSARLGADSYQMLRAMTIHPAVTFGLDDRVGSLEVGKDADIVLYTADPLDPRTQVVRVWIDGQSEYENPNVQERL
ncbi:MAG: imidazolonepropionase-like amidohydrolase [Candidatus Paceibacteria bacterium]|jgi:imidazolonepropionase-like amidohydrolase